MSFQLTISQTTIKVKSRQDPSGTNQRPTTLRLRSTTGNGSGSGGGDRSAGNPENDLPLLEDFRAEAEQFVANTIEARKEQHKKWNQHWVDETKFPITPPLEEEDWAGTGGNLAEVGVFDEDLYFEEVDEDGTEVGGGVAGYCEGLVWEEEKSRGRAGERKEKRDG